MGTVASYPNPSRALLDTDVLLGEASGQTVSIPVSALVAIATADLDPVSADALSTAIETIQGALAQGLEQKVDRYPVNPYSMLAVGYATTYASWLNRFFDTANNRMFPVRGLGPTNAGCVDLTLPDGNGNRMSPWMWGQEMAALCEQARISNYATADVGRIAGAWAYFLTQFPKAEILNTTYGSNGTHGAFDDCCWFLLTLWDIYTITNDATARSCLIEYGPLALQVYRDSRSGNPLIDSGLSTPGGIAFKWNTYGCLYNYNGAGTGGDFSASYEIMLAYVMLQISQLPTASDLPASLKSAFLNYAVDRWQWAFTYLRNPQNTTDLAAMSLIYASAMVLNPSSARYHLIKDGDDAPTTQRGDTCWADHGTLAMLTLSGRLYEVTGTAKYLGEMQSIASAYPAQNGFGRQWMALPCLVNAQDPWTDGRFHAEAVRMLISHVAPTASPLFFQAILNTACFIQAMAVDGRLAAEWGPPERRSQGKPASWPAESMDGYSGSGGGGQADSRQAMTSGTSMTVLQAAQYITPYESLLGSGLIGDVPYSRLPAMVGAAMLAIYYNEYNPIKHVGSSRLQMNTASDYVQVFADEQEVTRFLGSGNMWLIGSANIANDPNFFLGNVYGNRAINFASGQFIDYDGARTHFWSVNTKKVSFDTSGNIRTVGAVTQNDSAGDI